MTKSAENSLMENFIFCAVGFGNSMHMKKYQHPHKKSKHFIRLPPAQFWTLYDFLDTAHFSITYWNESKS